MNVMSYAPRLWEHPQWMTDRDVVDFGEVRPGHPEETVLIVTNAGAGPTFLRATLRSQQPWLQLRLSANEEWQSEVEVLGLQAGGSCAIALRADPMAVEGHYGETEAAIEVRAEVENPIPPLTARAKFLLPRNLLLELDQPETGSPQFTLAGAARGRHLLLEAPHTPLGQKPTARVRLLRSDGNASRVHPSCLRVTQGSPQWVDCQVVLEGRGQCLQVTFFTANRKPDDTCVVELDVYDSDPLVEPARLTLTVGIARPPLLAITPVETVVGMARPETFQTKLLNEGDGLLRVDFVEVPDEFSEWLSVRSVHDQALATGEHLVVELTVDGTKLEPRLYQGVVLVHCNHRGRPAQCSLPVNVEVIAQVLHVELDPREWNREVRQGQRVTVTFKVINSSAAGASARLMVTSLCPSAPRWLDVEPAILELPAARGVEARVVINARELPKDSREMTGEVALFGDGSTLPLWQGKLVVRLKRGWLW